MRWTGRRALRQSAAMGTPSFLLLRRIDPSRNMARFYALSLGPSLFGDVSLTRRWGRIGTIGRQIVELHADREAALCALERIEQAKRRRGYH